MIKKQIKKKNTLSGQKKQTSKKQATEPIDVGHTQKLAFFVATQDRIQKLTSGIKERSLKQMDKNPTVWIISIVSVVIVLIFAGLFISTQIQLHNVKQDLAEQKADPTILIREENKKLVEQVGALVILPQGEEPTIATVNDLSKLEGQPFFANAQIGDKVLIFTKAQKAILFRPVENKVIEFAPLVNSQSAS